MTSDEAREKSLRLFVAIELPSAWLDSLGDLVNQLRERLGPVRLRWVRPEGIHLTLKFIGQTAPSLVPAIESTLADALTTPPALRLALGGLGTFGDRGIPRVVWVGLEGDIEPLRAVAGRIDASLRHLGIAAEKRPLAPHLTLARVPDGFSRADAGALAAALGSVPIPAAPPLEVLSVSLILSRLGPGGARYERLASFPPPSLTTGKP